MPHSPPNYAKSRTGISADINGLLPMLQWLDLKLEVAIANTDSQPDDTDPEAITIPQDAPLAWLQQNFALSEFELKVIAIAIAPELDRRYEQLYAYIQDDIRRKRPTVELALNLICANTEAKLAARAYFTPDAPLIRHRLLQLIAESEESKPTLLARKLDLDDQVINLLLNQSGLDPRLMTYGKFVQPKISLDQLGLSAKVKQGLMQLTLQHWQSGVPLRLYFQGSDQAGNRQVAEALAEKVQVPILTINLARIVERKADFELILFLILREAWFQNTWLYFDHLDVLINDRQLTDYHSLIMALAEVKVITILSGLQPLVPIACGALGIVTIPLATPDFDQRRYHWQRCLAKTGLIIDTSVLDALSDRFRLTSEQIANAVAIADHTSQWQAALAEENISDINNLFAAARSQSGHDLMALARKIEPKYGWDDIVLPPQQLALLQELCNEAKYQHLVWNTWGFDQKISLGKGLNVLFSGPSGTGKTMAAEVIAHELQLDLYKIDLSQIVSKYIGETEKSLNQVFTSASNSNAILFFDEADALFGKRSEVSDAHDRYANIETSYLLQKMEEYEGIAILTTNLRSNMDEAFGRRLRFIIEFTLPSAKERRCIWERTCPKQMPRSQDIDFDFLARHFEISGANIRNVLLRAAFLAADDQQAEVNMRHLIFALRREYQKMGKILMLEELGEYAKLL